jgi:S-adenosylmethionine-dependent methyltransferase
MNRERFDASIDEWLNYQSSNAGRLRTELLWRGLQPHLPDQPCQVLDIGGGTGDLAEKLARAGHRVALMDYSPAMLHAAAERLRGLDVTLVCADIQEDGGRWMIDDGASHDRLSSIVRRQPFDVIVCHSVLEFVERPSDVIARCKAWLKPNGVLSVAFGNQRHGALRAAIVENDLARAQHDLYMAPNATDRFGLPMRLFEPEYVHDVLRTHGFEIRAEYGIRVVTDLLDKDTSSAPENYDALLNLESDMIVMPAYRHVGRFVQVIARIVI